MNNYFDFSNRAIRTLKVKLNDRLTVLVTAPTLKLLNELSNFDVKDTNPNQIMKLALKIFNNNKGSRRVDLKDIENISTDDLVEFIKEYTEFIGSVTKDPN
ncbi:hypothetical protein [Dielma fastidiosa]|uniref:Uncharacterized protein n=1 Tax=Dielma fastidiosa TaxID=1034346 RepID=A0A318KHK1_9FIRM|nr:hypothetical protein [Dielma fastidiosa]PXX74648.1 hypothetical protein DES51_12234 [Dielma fastidiosa]